MRFSLTPARFDDPAATQEERATAGRLEIQAGGLVLTEGVAYGQDSLLPGPLVSAYPLAEWLVWNRWRILWEPRPAVPSREWEFAHRLPSVGSGYLWPNIELASDGQRVRLTSSPPQDPRPCAFRYVGAPRSARIAAAELEAAIDGFAERVLVELGRSKIAGSNLQVLCDETEQERGDERASIYRRVEASLGADPGEGDIAAIKRRISEVEVLGKAAVMELAADGVHAGAGELRTSLERTGFDTRPSDAMQLKDAEGVRNWGSTRAWMVGVALAHEARKCAGVRDEPLTNARLSDLAGVQRRSLEDNERVAEEVSLEWRTGCGARIALRSKWTTGRRFDLARLLADRWLPDGQQDSVLPATRASTYRQKVQRAFAAEFLAPADALDSFLDGDFTDAKQEDAAEHFEVSPLAVRAILVNNRLGDANAIPEPGCDGPVWLLSMSPSRRGEHGKRRCPRELPLAAAVRELGALGGWAIEHVGGVGRSR